MTTSVESLLLPRLTPPVALVRERRTVTAQAGDVSSSRSNITLQTHSGEFRSTVHRVTQLLQQKIRRQQRAKRAQMPADERAIAAQKIAEIVFESSWFWRCNSLACYLSSADEVCTWQIIERAHRMKKRIFAPVVKKNSYMMFRELTAFSELRQNKFGLLEPKSGKIANVQQLDVVIAPVVAFDSSNHRIGMGGGYFDRTFSVLRNRKHYFRPKLFGLAFACQEIGEISPNPWDIRLSDVITENS